MKKTLKMAIAGIATLAAVSTTLADDYVIDTEGMHAFVQFRVKHLGYSWLYGRFNNFSGDFSYNESDASASRIAVEIDTTSLDTNHAERDKHLRSADFLDVEQFPTATFESTAYSPTGDNSADLTGNLTLHGVTNEVVVSVEHIGGGDDPWGGFRQGFEGRATIEPGDYGIDMVGQLGPDAATVELMLTVEGVRK